MKVAIELIWKLDEYEIARPQAFMAQMFTNALVRHRIKSNVEVPPLDKFPKWEHNLMRVIKQKTLSTFWAKHPDAEGALKAWLAEAERSQWKISQDILDRYRYADILPGNRAVFNIRGNRYRLVVKIHYNTGLVYIRFVGTHAEYDRIDAEQI